MKNLYIDPTTKDLLVENFNLRLTQNNVEWVAQTLENRLKTFLGEWYLNRSLGIPYFETVFKKPADITEINALFLTEITSIDEVEEVLAFTTTFDTENRNYLVQFTVKAAEDIIEGEVTV